MEPCFTHNYLVKWNEPPMEDLIGSAIRIDTVYRGAFLNLNAQLVLIAVSQLIGEMLLN